MLDEGPSPDDLERFGHDSAYCPFCGEEIWDAAPACAACGHVLPEGPGRFAPEQARLNRKVILAVAIAALVGFVILML